MKKFDVPIVLIFFNRPHYLKRLLEIIQKIQPQKLYLISDYARDDKKDEVKLVNECRRLVDEMVNWDCDVRKNYTDINKGCYDRIANGASWVFSQEEEAIFLEDDNLPSLSFFEYCRENLNKYRNEEKIFWICGGNYLVDYQNDSKGDYLFSQQMFPCGWASWRRAWKHYDGSLEYFDDPLVRQKVLDKIKNKNIRNYKKIVWEKLRNQYLKGERLYTWDHQWNFTILKNDAYGIVPKKNLITNIGIGLDSTHGGVKLTNHLKKIVMLENHELKFPLDHPTDIKLDQKFENAIQKRIKGVPNYILFLSKLKKKLIKKGNKQ